MCQFCCCNDDEVWWFAGGPSEDLQAECVISRAASFLPYIFILIHSSCPSRQLLNAIALKVLFQKGYWKVNRGVSAAAKFFSWTNFGEVIWQMKPPRNLHRILIFSSSFVVSDLLLRILLHKSIKKKNKKTVTKIYNVMMSQLPWDCRSTFFSAKENITCLSKKHKKLQILPLILVRGKFGLRMSALSIKKKTLKKCSWLSMSGRGQHAKIWEHRTPG